MPPVDTDPHFLIHVPQKEDTLCFNINEEPGVVLSLVQDPDTGTGDIMPSAREGGAWALLSSTFSHDQEGQWLWPPLPSPCVPATWLGSAGLLHAPAACLGPIQGLLHRHVTCAGAQDPALGRTPCLIECSAVAS